MALKRTIEALAQQFADGIMQAIRGASLEELLRDGSTGNVGARRRPGRPKGSKATSAGQEGNSPSKAKTKDGRLLRRSESDLQHLVGLLVATLGDAKDGMRSEDLQKALKLSKKEIVRPLGIALDSKRVTKKGQKRATRYFAK